MPDDPATFAHEARNQLTVLIGRLQLLRRRAVRRGTDPLLSLRQLDELHGRMWRLADMTDERDGIATPRRRHAPRQTPHAPEAQ